MTTKIGTPYYVSPEILEGKYDMSCDMWSVGIITYIMLFGYPPFNGKTEQQLFNKIMTCDYSFCEKDWSHISEDAQDFIKKLLSPNPKTRMTAE